MKICSKCKVEKSDEYFGFKNKRIKKYSKIRRKELFEKFLAYLSDKSCKECGINDMRVLDFDHRNPKQKRDSVHTLISHGCS